MNILQESTSTSSLSPSPASLFFPLLSSSTTMIPLSPYPHKHHLNTSSKFCFFCFLLSPVYSISISSTFSLQLSELSLFIYMITLHLEHVSSSVFVTYRIYTKSKYNFPSLFLFLLFFFRLCSVNFSRY